MAVPAAELLFPAAAGLAGERVDSLLPHRMVGEAERLGDVGIEHGLTARGARTCGQPRRDLLGAPAQCGPYLRAAGIAAPAGGAGGIGDQTAAAVDHELRAGREELGVREHEVEPASHTTAATSAGRGLNTRLAISICTG